MNRLQDQTGQDLANDYDRVWFPPETASAECALGEGEVMFTCETDAPGRIKRTFVIVNDAGEVIARRREPR